MRPTTVIVALLALVLGGCGDSDGRADTSDWPGGSVPLDTGVTLDTSEPWDLVWISDSSGQWIADEWAILIEEAEGVEVRVHDYMIGGVKAEVILQMLSDVENIREKVAEAEVIVVHGAPSDDTGPPDTLVCRSTGAINPDPPSLPADFTVYGDVYRDIFDVIFELRAGRPTVIRAYDEWAGLVVLWGEEGIEEECTAAWEAQAGAIHEAAAEYGVVTASFYDAANGPDHDEDPQEKGYTAGDGYHPSPEGASAMAEVLHSLGYGAIIP